MEKDDKRMVWDGTFAGKAFFERRWGPHMLVGHGGVVRCEVCVVVKMGVVREGV